MLASDERPVQIINELIIVNNNRLLGFNYAQEEADATVLKILFSRLTETSLVCKKELVDEVYKLGGQPASDSNLLTDFTRAWEEINDALSQKNHLSLLRSCEQEETVVIKMYENVLSNEDDINSQQQRLLCRHCELLHADHNKVKNLLNVLLKTG